MRVRRLRQKAEKEGRVLADDDVKVFEERKFYGGLRKKDDSANSELPTGSV